MLGFIVAFWATPHMTLTHLVFAITTTAYTVTALRFEERDLVAGISAPYQEYSRRMPMILPLPRRFP